MGYFWGRRHLQYIDVQVYTTAFHKQLLLVCQGMSPGKHPSANLIKCVYNLTCVVSIKMDKF